MTKPGTPYLPDVSLSTRLPTASSQTASGAREAASFIAEGAGWCDAWSQLPPQTVQLFTRGEPQTLSQFWQRCYFEDIWACMGDRAASGRYLEVGAGRGTTSMYLASRGCDVTMVDLSPIGFQVAEQNFCREGIKLPRQVVADARNTGLPAASFDCIFSIGLLEHFEDPQPLVDETRRLLAPGGLAFHVIIPTRPDSIRWLVRLAFRPWSNAGQFFRRQMNRKQSVSEQLPSAPSPHRNELFGAPYEAMARHPEVTDVACRPYNSYHTVYDRGPWQKWLVNRCYRWHYGWKRYRGIAPALQTWSSLASCCLLTFRKRDQV